MTNKDAIKELIFRVDYAKSFEHSDADFVPVEALDLAIKALENSSWIPVTTRDLSAEEIEELVKSTEHMFNADDIEHWTYSCQLPDENQDVLITTHYGDVTIASFYADEYGCYFEDYEDRDDVLAWMPLPEPYKKEETT